MRRALQLAANGRRWTSPNPMVGAVIVCDGRIIGEGWHRRFGGPHAEVNAVRSVADPAMLRRSTIYVTLEPCSHYGKTPPCAKLLIDMGLPRVVVGSLDPNEKVAGRGVRMLREAGADVTVGVLEEECRALNRAFMTAHTLRRPYVMLKWACSADGFLDCERAEGEPAPRFSTAESMQRMHSLRADFDAIMVGSSTVINDDPRLDVRLFAGRSPQRVVVDRRGRLCDDRNVFRGAPTLLYSSGGAAPGTAELIHVDADAELFPILDDLFSRGVISVMVEGGATLLKSFIAQNLWDEARIEISPLNLGSGGRCRMSIPQGEIAVESLGENSILRVRRL